MPGELDLPVPSACSASPPSSVSVLCLGEAQAAACLGLGRIRRLRFCLMNLLQHVTTFRGWTERAVVLAGLGPAGKAQEVAGGGEHTLPLPSALKQKGDHKDLLPGGVCLEVPVVVGRKQPSLARSTCAVWFRDPGLCRLHRTLGVYSSPLRTSLPLEGTRGPECQPSPTSQLPSPLHAGEDSGGRGCGKSGPGMPQLPLVSACQQCHGLPWAKRHIRLAS